MSCVFQEKQSQAVSSAVHKVTPQSHRTADETSEGWTREPQLLGPWRGTRPGSDECPPPRGCPDRGWRRKGSGHPAVQPGQRPDTGGKRRRCSQDPGRRWKVPLSALWLMEEPSLQPWRGETHCGKGSPQNYWRSSLIIFLFKEVRCSFSCKYHPVQHNCIHLEIVKKEMNKPTMSTDSSSCSCLRWVGALCLLGASVSYT